MGYVGEISEEELADSATWQGYEPGRPIGTTGIERQYESVLGGVPGERYVEVDARGQVMGMLASEETKAPVPGRDIRLTMTWSCSASRTRSSPRR
jgi:penicillin-binding protein 2